MEVTKRCLWSPTSDITMRLRVSHNGRGLLHRLEPAILAKHVLCVQEPVRCLVNDREGAVDDTVLVEFLENLEDLNIDSTLCQFHNVLLNLWELVLIFVSKTSLENCFGCWRRQDFLQPPPFLERFRRLVNHRFSDRREKIVEPDLCTDSYSAPY